jgi:hypothetical protein
VFFGHRRQEVASGGLTGVSAMVPIRAAKVEIGAPQAGNRAAD